MSVRVPLRRRLSLCLMFLFLAVLPFLLGAAGTEAEPACWAWLILFALMSLLSAVCPDIFLSPG